MKKTFKDLFKLATALATVAGIAYVARDQIKAIIDKVKEVSGDDTSLTLSIKSKKYQEMILMMISMKILLMMTLSTKKKSSTSQQRMTETMFPSISQKAMIVQTKKMKQGKLHLQKTKSNII